MKSIVHQDVGKPDNSGEFVRCPICGLPAMSVMSIRGAVKTRHRCRKCKHWFTIEIAE